MRALIRTWQNSTTFEKTILAAWTTIALTWLGLFFWVIASTP